MRRLLPSTALLLVVACTPPPERAGDHEDAAPTSEPAPASVRPEPLSPPPLPTAELEPTADGFELLSPGAEPREPLRFAPRTGAHERVELTLAQTMGVEGSAMPPMRQVLPPVTQVATTDTQVVDGRITARLVHEDLRVESAAEHPMRAALEQIAGFEQILIFDERGEPLDRRVSLPAQTNPQASKTLETLGRIFEQSLVRFPEQPVGVGAKWKLSYPVDSGGLALEHTVEFTLVAREGKRVSVEAQVSQRPRTMTFTAPERGTELEIVEFESKGSSRLEYDLDAMLPVAASSQLETRFTTQTKTEPPQQLSFELLLALGLRRVAD